MKNESTWQNFHNHLHGVNSTEYVPGKNKRKVSLVWVERLGMSICARQEPFCFRRDKNDEKRKIRLLLYTIQRCPTWYTEDEEEERKKERKKEIKKKTTMMMMWLIWDEGLARLIPCFLTNLSLWLYEKAGRPAFCSVLFFVIGFYYYRQSLGFWMIKEKLFHPRDLSGCQLLTKNFAEFSRISGYFVFYR